MHFPAFLIAATALCATSASAGCFGSGLHWGNHDEAKGALADACGGLQGAYNAGETKDVCKNRPSDSNLSYQFQVVNKSGGTVSISQADCEQHIGGIIDTCGHGGDLTVNDVTYRYI